MYELFAEQRMDQSPYTLLRDFVLREQTGHVIIVIVIVVI